MENSFLVKVIGNSFCGQSYGKKLITKNNALIIKILKHIF